MTTPVLIGALVVAVVAAAAAAVAAWRERASSDDRVAEAVAGLAAAMHETMQDLANALDEAHRDRSQLHRQPRELAASLDLDEIAARTLEAAAAVAGVEAILLTAAGPGGERFQSALGLGEGELDAASLSVPDDDNVRAVEVALRYRIDDVDEATPRLRSGVVLPLPGSRTPAGSLTALTRSSERRLAEPAIEELELIAARAGPAFANARSYAETKAQAAVDAITTLGNLRTFHEALDRETVRAQRHDRLLSLIVLDVDDFAALNDRIGQPAGDALLAELAERLLSIVRASDLVCRVGGDEFAALLPETGLDSAALLAGRIAQAVAARPVGAAGTVHVSAGVAMLRGGDGPGDLHRRAREALSRAKELGKARTVAAEK
jgi:diguanylate cyclase (GGDEF)-like protein